MSPMPGLAPSPSMADLMPSMRFNTAAPDVLDALGGPSAAAGTVTVRMGTIVSDQGNGTYTITVAGSTAQIAGVRGLNALGLIAGATCWIMVRGADLLIIGTTSDGSVWTPVKPYYEVTKTAAQTLATGTTATVSNYAAATVNVGGITVSSGVFTVPRAGRYQISGSVTFVGNASGRRLININKGGTDTYSNSLFSTGTGAGIVGVSGTHYCAANTTLAVTAQQTSGGNLDISSGIVSIAYLD